MKVENGINLELKCIGVVSESKIVIQEKEINFGIITVSK